jgi:hypothetical protein
VLSDFIDDEGQHLMFTFDYINDRSFFLEMKELITGRTLRDPVCTLSLGTPPPQEQEPEPLVAPTTGKGKSQTTLDDFDDPLYDEQGFNPDEFDEEGFSEMSFDD